MYATYVKTDVSIAKEIINAPSARTGRQRADMASLTKKQKQSLTKHIGNQ